MIKFTLEETENAVKTARSAGAIGKNAITPKYIIQHMDKNASILDFGSGIKAIHTNALKHAGFIDVTAYDFSLHNEEVLYHTYDCVMASNVLNVQSSVHMFHCTLSQIIKVLHSDGILICNFPTSPRKCFEIDETYIEEELKKVFKHVDRVGGTKQSPLFKCKNS